ncbi:MAG: hypothetical protein HRT69_05840, partial [Flavobacteriaceae bacterium]|nr:hypothetical protein [Flavobacteriaceae bacterium]
MNKLTYLVILTVSVLYTSNSVAQSFSLPSPSASSMTRYVGTSVNESSGRVVKSIPLYNYQAGNLSIPLGLTYVGNGVKVDQQSNWTGTNWDLSYGGVVTRTLNHLADEKATNRLTVADIPSLTDPNNIDNINDILQGVNQTDDLRPDVFTFTFPGYSGSFYFDNSGTPRLMDANTKLKIEFSSSITNGPINTIVITTMSGVEYYFGGDDASESTSMVLQEVAKNVAADTPPDFTGVTETITAFYLYKIKHPFGDEILFDYHDDGVQILSRFFNGNGIGAELSNGCKAILYYAGFFDKSKKQIYWGKISGRKKISKIHSPNSDSEIRFNSTQLYLAPVATNYNTVTPQYDDRRLNSIHVYNNLLGENTKQIKLSYIDTPYRFFLEEVEMNNETDVNSASKCSSYKMEYDDVNSLPHRFSLNQDMLGYYRGPVIINGIPSTYNGFNHVSINNSSHPGYVKKGALKKMYYPSGGHTFFEYETPAVATLLPINISLFANKGQSSTLLPNKPSDFILSFSANQAQEITVNVNIQQTNTSIDFPNDKVYIKLYEYGFPANPEIIDFVALVPGVSVYNQSFNFSLKKGVSYRLELNANSVTDTPFIATATTSFVNKTIFPSSGLRVEKISDYPKEGDINPLVKKYYYKRAERALSDNT